MRSTTRGTPYRNAGQSRCLGRVAALFALATPFALGLGACAKSSGIEVADGGTIGVGGSGPDAGDDLSGVIVTPGGDCGTGSTLCGTGNGCCAAGYVCSKANSTCIPDKACTQSSDCSSDSVCGGGKCVAWASFPTSLNYSNSCRSQVDLPSLRPEVQCSWPGNTPPGDSPDAVQVISTPMVVDFDFDNDKTTLHPSIVFISYTGDYTKVTGVLRVIDGATCALQATIPGATVPGEFPFLPQVAPAIGDIDGDGRPDIVVADVHSDSTFSTKYGVAVFTPVGDGTTNFKLIGRQDSSATAPVQAISLHDLDNDSRAEIITDTGIFEFSPDLQGKVVERDNISGSALEPPIVHDIDGDRIAEMITTQGIFSWDAQNHKVVPKTINGNPVWRDQDFLQSQFIGAANMGNFPTQLPGGNDSVELVVVGFAGQMYVTRVDGGIIQNINLPSTSGGPPVIADFDGDTRMEFASPGFDQMTVFDLDCLTNDSAKPVKANCMGTPNANGILWQVTGLHGATSGASVFDFDGDHRAEVVYADQCFMRIFDGPTGKVEFSVPRSSETRWEYPVIADVDGDSHTEIVTVSNDFNADTLGCPATDPVNMNESVAFKATHGVTVWADHNKQWAGSRPIWNQHSYNVTNVNDDGTIPPMGKIVNQWNDSADDPNSFRQNVQGATGVSLELPDVTTVGIPGFKCLTSQAMANVSVQMCNRGLKTVPVGQSNVALVAADNPQNVLCTKANSTELTSGKCENVSCTVAVPSQNSGFDILIMGDPSNSIPECDDSNNTSLISNVYCLVTQ